MRQKAEAQLSCPSAQPDQAVSTVIGVVGRRDGKPHVSLLPKSVSLDAVAHLIPDTIPVTEVLRLGAPCAESRCSHFSNQHCTLASRIVSRLPAVVDRLPALCASPLVPLVASGRSRRLPPVPADRHRASPRP